MSEECKEEPVQLLGGPYDGMFIDGSHHPEKIGLYYKKETERYEYRFGMSLSHITYYRRRIRVKERTWVDVFVSNNESSHRGWVDLWKNNDSMRKVGEWYKRNEGRFNTGKKWSDITLEHTKAVSNG